MQAVKKLETVVGIVSSTNVTGSVGAVPTGPEEAGWGPQLSLRGFGEAVMFVLLVLFASVLRGALPETPATTPLPPRLVARILTRRSAGATRASLDGHADQVRTATRAKELSIYVLSYMYALQVGAPSHAVHPSCAG